ncbi:MAG: hypothetical protein GY765_17745, partial [bacterium]|nr:hypothetical protein [bacterium]
FTIFFSLGTNLPRRQRWGFFSDEAGYFSITQSLFHDLDIKYTRQDLLRIKDYFPSGPVGFFLKKGADGELYYAKSFAYPMVAAPFLGIFGVRGLLLCNGLMLFLTILMGFFLLKQYFPQDKSFSFILMFVLASVTPLYIWWLTADLFNFFVMFTGLFFFFYQFKRPWLFYLSAVFFSLAAFSKAWNLAGIGIIYLILFHRKQWKKFVLLTLISIMIFCSMVLFLYLQTGQLSYSLFMGGDRRSFGNNFPYETPEYTFESGTRMSFDNYWQRFYISPKVIVTNLFYYFFGRYTGMFIYFFPAVFLLILFFFQRKVPEDWFVFIAIVVLSLVYLVLAPDNYFGGSGSIGNRYFLNIFPLFFFLGFRNRVFKLMLVPVVVALVFLSSTYVDSNHRSSTPRYVGLSFPINLFPPEKTQYLSLPTNENPRAFGVPVHDGENSYQLFFVNDNYHTVANDSFWSNGTDTLEVFLSSPREVREFQFRVNTKAEKNRVSVSIEGHKKEGLIGPGRKYTISFKNVEGLKMKNKYVYYIRIRASKSYCGYMETLNDADMRHLGVQTHIGVVH